MRGGIGQIILLAAGTAAPVGAGTMTNHPSQVCRIISGEKLLAGAGGKTALCREIASAMSAASIRDNYQAEITISSRSRLAATLIVNGRRLPEQHFAVMDATLSRTTLKRFAEGLADAAKAGNR